MVQLIDTSGVVRFEGTIEGGGSQPFPDSWLVARVDTPLTADGNPSWNLGSSAGSDINVDGGDDTIINIVTPGVYEIAWMMGLLGDGAAAGPVVIALAGSINTAPDWLGWLADHVDPPLDNQMCVPNMNTDITISLPAVRIAAPVTVQLSIFTSSLTAGTCQVGTAGWILIRRLL